MPLVAQLRPGAYADSVVLMQLQRALAALPGIEDAGVVMGTVANRALLAAGNLGAPEVAAAGDTDLLIVLRCADDAAGAAALAKVDELLTRRGGGTGTDDDYRPRTLAAAAQLAADARWVLISTPGRYAAAVAREALALGRHVFLYSDNVEVSDEAALKRDAAARGLLVMGPDCGTALVGGVGLGFANRVRRGPIGIVGASGTGLQAVSARIHQLGSGVSHALGTGGRDLSESIGAITATQSLDLLRRDPDTRVIVLISKPPAPAVAEQLLRAARRAGKPVVVCFIGYGAANSAAGSAMPDGALTFAPTLDAAAEVAVELAARQPAPSSADGSGFLRALYSGGTLAYEAQLLLRDTLPGVWSNAPLDKAWRLEDAMASREHTVLDLGDDAFTVGRLHPMLDNELRIRRLLHEAADAGTGAILLDVVLGDGAHADPAAELAPAIAQARALAADAGRSLPVVVALIGTDADPQGLAQQAAALRAAGADVHLRHSDAVAAAAAAVSAATSTLPPVALEALAQPFSALNVGLDSFAQSLRDQGAAVLALDWRPPAPGNERLAGILARMKRTTA